MKTTVRTTLAVIVLGSMFAAVIPAKAAQYTVTSPNSGLEIRGNDGASYDLDAVTRTTVDNTNQIQQEHLTNNNQQGLIMQNANDISSVNSKLDSVNKQLTDSIVDESNARSGADSALGQRITTLENAPKPTNGVDGKDGVNGKDGATGAKGDKGDTGATGAVGANGKDGVDGKDGVTTTVTKVQVDTATQAKVDSNSKQVAGNTVAVDNVQSRQQAQETTIRRHSSQLSNHEERITALENENNNNFQNLKNDVDNNRKRAAVGVASVAAMSNIPQVTDSQTFAIGAGVGEYDSQGAIAVGFSARVTERVVTKASVGAGSYGCATVGAGVSYGW